MPADTRLEWTLLTQFLPEALASYRARSAAGKRPSLLGTGMG
jgi:hypothetical protein